MSRPFVILIVCSIFWFIDDSVAQDDAESDQTVVQETPSLLQQLTEAISGAVSEAAGSTDPNRDVAPVIWHSTLNDAIDDARQQGKPVFVVVGAPWCGFCDKLHEELEGDAETAMSEKWVLAKINADDEVNDARELHANALPALRLLSSDGITAASRDGYLPVAQLTEWLSENYEITQARMPGLLAKDIEALDENEIETLIKLMAVRDVTARRVVLNRLGEMPAKAVHQTIDLFASGNLAHQLSALHLLTQWNAPVEGLDPWEPTSIDEASIDRLKVWVSENYPVSNPAR